jgi:anti-sigma factor RsiW
MHPVEELLPAYVAGLLDADRVRDVEVHLADCETCTGLAREWETIRSAAHAGASAIPMPSRGVLDRALAKIDADAQGPGWRSRWTPAVLRRPLIRRSLVGAVAAASLALVAAFTPVGSFAQGLLDVMRPQQFVVVPVTRADLEALPSLRLYGEFSQVGSARPQHSTGAAAAGASTGMSVLTPAYLPASVTGTPAYAVLPGQSATFTFSAAKATAAALAQGKPLPPMPANIDGSSVQLTAGAAVVAVYGGKAGMLGGGIEAPAPAVAPTGAAGPIPDLAGAIPQLVVAQAVAPVATASGVTAKELQQYLLAQPGISEQLANAVRALGDPTTTWPIPMPLGAVNTHTVSVQGVRGTVFADTSGFAVGVMWLKGGIIYAVAAPLNEQDVLRVANSLR